jgi:hypothetical protein
MPGVMPPESCDDEHLRPNWRHLLGHAPTPLFVQEPRQAVSQNQGFMRLIAEHKRGCFQRWKNLRCDKT